MRILFPLIFSTVFIVVVGLVGMLLLRFLNREWWRRKWIRRIAIYLPVVGIVMVAAWGAGEYYTIRWLGTPGAMGTAAVFILEVCILLSLPISGLFHLAGHLRDWCFRKHRGIDTSSNRRDFLKIAAAAVPTVTLSMGIGGVTGGVTDSLVYLRQIRVANLPPTLEGLRILHLSDTHLTRYVVLDDLEGMLQRAAALKPEMIVVTGDFVDDLRLLPDAIAKLTQTNASLGVFASLGNHEYFRGVRHVRRSFDASTIPLLVNEAITIERGGGSFVLGGLDDPRRMGAKEANFFRAAIDQTLDATPSDSPVILLSHRPDAFDYAAEIGATLTLAGHTHGGQIGLMGRSLFESMWPDRYLWGEYQKNDSHLYTSAGAGHWFPFRLGCPAEAPVIELVRA